MLDLVRLRAAYERAKAELLAERVPAGHWVGELSSSALATATAVSALAVVRTQASGGREPSEEFACSAARLDDLIRRGVAYLSGQQNADGGFGDTDLSHSNIATTYLVVAALHLAGVAAEHVELLNRANAYIDRQGRLDGLRKRYGIDKTFVVPIMTNLALAGLIGWRDIDPLPFELASVPQSWYRFVGMPVVSYAIPALVAIGQARYFHAPPRNPFTRLTRWLSITRSLIVLRRMQPDSGGYLEATPLTSFVVMSLASGAVQGPKSEVQSRIADDVIRGGVRFLANSIRPDGSWPIDTNLATWNTTLAINALAGAEENVAELLGPQCLDWLLSCQHTQRHPFTGADPGGFGWSDLSGAVPDADDTPGALLAIHTIDSQNDKRVELAADRGLGWLARLRNRNGGWPTFCRGWGKLPFDRSGTDLTAHALRAFSAYGNYFVDSDLDHFGEAAQKSKQNLRAGLGYVRTNQHPDGSWSPLWFGNQDRPDEDNPVYGTAKVLMAYRDLGLMDSPEAKRGVAWLVASQNEDGGWGSGVWGRFQISEFRFQIGDTENLQCAAGVESGEQPSSIPNLQLPIINLQSSVEETALAVEALLAAISTGDARNATEGVPCSASSQPPASSPQPPAPSPATAVARGLAWLIDRVEQGQHRQPAPIGFYFAKLWYYEKLYPLTFTVAALGRACRQFARPEQPDSHAAASRLSRAVRTTPWTMHP